MLNCPSAPYTILQFFKAQDDILGKLKITYKKELIRSMNYLGRHRKTIFLGQSVMYPGNSMYNTLVGVPDKKKIELPVFEDVQMGLSIGLALEGFIPISCYPRFDFLILAFNQLVNHLDKIRYMSRNEMKPQIIIRTAIGAKKPLDGGPQHTQDYTSIFKKVLTEVEVIKLQDKDKIFDVFKKAITDKNKKSYLIIENGDMFNKD